MSKDIVKLREKSLSNGNKSLYLDYYNNGSRTYEFLKIYIVPEKSKLDKAKNKVAYEAAKTIQAHRIIEIQKGAAKILKRNTKTKFHDYVIKYMERKKYSDKGKESIICKLTSWERFAGKDIFIEDITTDMLQKYCHELQTRLTYISTKKKLTPGSQYSYFSFIRIILTRAVKDGIISVNPANRLNTNDIPREKYKERNFLTVDEIKQLMEIPCRDEEVKKAFFFSCFTGLRLSDICNLTWDMISHNTIRLVQQKTETSVSIPLSDNAKMFLPKKIKDDSHMFHFRVKYHSIRKVIKEWISASDLNKNITFHCARHTFATLELTYGADIYTVSSLLGHMKVTTTQIYAKIIDKKKEEAVNLIPKI